MTTHVINFFAGPGSGKSTTAAQLFSKLKYMSKEVELVREYMKMWAWTGRKPDKFSQFYITGKQVQAESQLYGKVDFIVTDSPILLGPFYETRYAKREIVLPSVLNFMDFAEKNGVVYHNYFLKRQKDFKQGGRYETEDEAKQIDEDLKSFLTVHNIPWQFIEVPDEERINYILRDLELYVPL